MVWAEQVRRLSVQSVDIVGLKSGIVNPRFCLNLGLNGVPSDLYLIKALHPPWKCRAVLRIHFTAQSFHNPAWPDLRIEISGIDLVECGSHGLFCVRVENEARHDVLDVASSCCCCDSIPEAECDVRG